MYRPCCTPELYDRVKRHLIDSSHALVRILHFAYEDDLNDIAGVNHFGNYNSRIVRTAPEPLQMEKVSAQTNKSKIH